MGYRVEVWGEWALFSRPELKVERMSYDVMTPSAARGLLESIFFHPGMRWRIDKIHVLAPIQFAAVRRNEVTQRVLASDIRRLMTEGGGKSCIVTKDCIAQRASLLLKDVRYVIDAHFDMTERAAPTDNEGKFADIIRRRLEKGQFYSQPYFGCREFPANFQPWTGGEMPNPNADRELGLMLYDMDYTDPKNITPMYFRAALRGGAVNVPAWDSGEVLQ